MTFRYEHTHLTRQELLHDLETHSFPDSIRAFVRDAATAVTGDESRLRFSVRIFGHLHNGADHDHSSVSVSVQPHWGRAPDDDDDAA